MTFEEWRRVIVSLSNAVDEFFVVADALNEGLRSADEIVSGFGGPVGLEQAFIDLTADRDRYPLPQAYARIVHVERLDNDSAMPWPLSPAIPTQFSEADNRPGRGAGYWSPIGEAQLLIYPPPDTSYDKGLRVWGYPRHEVSPQVQPEHEVACPPHSQDYVKWYAVNILSLGKERRDRALQQLQRAELTFRKHVEIPHVGVPQNVIREAF